MDILIVHNIFQEQVKNEMEELLTKKFRLRAEQGFILSDIYTCAFKGRLKDMKELKADLKELLEKYSFIGTGSVLAYYNRGSKMVRKFIY